MKTILFILFFNFINLEFIYAMNSGASGSGTPSSGRGGRGSGRGSRGGRTGLSPSGRKRPSSQIAQGSGDSGGSGNSSGNQQAAAGQPWDPRTSSRNTNLGAIHHIRLYDQIGPNEYACTKCPPGTIIPYKNEKGQTNCLHKHMSSTHKDLVETYESKRKESDSIYEPLKENFDIDTKAKTATCKLCTDKKSIKVWTQTDMDKHMNYAHSRDHREVRSRIAERIRTFVGENAEQHSTLQKMQSDIAKMESGKKLFARAGWRKKSRQIGEDPSSGTHIDTAGTRPRIPLVSVSEQIQQQPQGSASSEPQQPQGQRMLGLSQQSIDRIAQAYGAGSSQQQQQRPQLSEQSLAEQQQQMSSFSGQQQQQTGLELVQDIARTFRDVNPSALLQTGQQTAQQIPVTQHMMQQLSVSEPQQGQGIHSGNLSGMLNSRMATQAARTLPSTGMQQPGSQADKGKGIADESQPRPQTQRRSTVGGLMPDARRTGTYPIGYEPPIPRRSTQQRTIQHGQMISFGTGTGTMPPPSSFTQGGATRRPTSLTTAGRGHSTLQSVSRTIQQHQTFGTPGTGHAFQAPSYNFGGISQHGPTQHQPSRLPSRSISRQIAQQSVPVPSFPSIGESMLDIARQLHEEDEVQSVPQGGTGHTPLRSLSRTMQQHQTFGTPAGGSGHFPQAPSTQHQPSRLGSGSISREIAHQSVPVPSSPSINFGVTPEEIVSFLGEHPTQSASQGGHLPSRSISRQIAQQSFPVPASPSLAFGESMAEGARQLYEEDEVQSAPQRETQSHVRPSSHLAASAAGSGQLVSVANAQATQNPPSSFLANQYGGQETYGAGGGSGQLARPSSFTGNQYAQSYGGTRTVRPSSSFVGHQTGQGGTYGGAGGSGAARPSSFAPIHSALGSYGGAGGTAAGVAPLSSHTTLLPLPPTATQQQSHQQSGQQLPPTSDAQ